MSFLTIGGVCAYYILILVTHSMFSSSTSAVPSNTFSNYPNYNGANQNIQMQQNHPRKISNLYSANNKLGMAAGQQPTLRANFSAYPVENIYQYYPPQQNLGNPHQQILTIQQSQPVSPTNAVRLSPVPQDPYTIVGYVKEMSEPLQTSKQPPVQQTTHSSVQYQLSQPPAGLTNVVQPAQLYITTMSRNIQPQFNTNAQSQTSQMYPQVLSSTYSQPMYSLHYPQRQIQGVYYQSPNQQGIAYIVPQAQSQQQQQSQQIIPQYVQQYASSYAAPFQYAQTAGYIPPISHYHQLPEQLYSGSNDRDNQQLKSATLSTSLATAKKLIPFILGDNFRDRDDIKSYQDEKKEAQNRQHRREEAVKKSKCKPGYVSLGGKCRSINIYSVSVD